MKLQATCSVTEPSRGFFEAARGAWMKNEWAQLFFFLNFFFWWPQGSRSLQRRPCQNVNRPVAQLGGGCVQLSSSSLLGSDTCSGLAASRVSLTSQQTRHDRRVDGYCHDRRRRPSVSSFFCFSLIFVPKKEMFRPAVRCTALTDVYCVALIIIVVPVVMC